jgi:hypothetical protein
MIQLRIFHLTTRNKSGGYADLERAGGARTCRQASSPALLTNGMSVMALCLPPCRCAKRKKKGRRGEGLEMSGRFVVEEASYLWLSSLVGTVMAEGLESRVRKRSQATRKFNGKRGAAFTGALPSCCCRLWGPRPTMAKKRGGAGGQEESGIQQTRRRWWAQQRSRPASLWPWTRGKNRGGGPRRREPREKKGRALALRVARTGKGTGGG